jgi:hypothetical protein
MIFNCEELRAGLGQDIQRFVAYWAENLWKWTTGQTHRPQTHPLEGQKSGHLIAH